MPTASNFRLERLRTIQELHKAGLSSPQIGREVGLAPSTVRDYLNDPTRVKARVRQRSRLLVLDGPTLGGTEVTTTRRRWKNNAQAKGHSIASAEKRGKQLRAVVGWAARRA